MKTHSSQFISQSDQQDIDKMVFKTQKKSKYKNPSSQQFKPSFNNTKQSNSFQKQDKDQQNKQFKAQKHLNANIMNRKKLVNKIVKLYHDFFNQQKSQTKAQQIMHIYKKKLCDQGIIIPTLFCWLNDWINKDFINFIKNSINQLTYYNNKHKNKKRQRKGQQNKSNYQTINRFDKYQTDKGLKEQIKNSPIIPNKQLKQSIQMKQSLIFQSPVQMIKNKYSRKLKKQIQPDMFFSIDLHYGAKKNQQKTNINSKIDKNQITKNNQQRLGQTQIFKRSKSKNRISGIKQQIFLTIQGGKQTTDKYYNKKTSKINKRLSTNSDIKQKSTNLYQISNLLPIKQQFTEQISKKQYFQQSQAPPINRQIIIGAYYEKFNNMYKNLQSIIPDLDIQYIKQIKRNDKNKQIKKRIKQISRNLVKNQPGIKNTIDQYYFDYHERKRKLINKNKINKKKNTINKQTIEEGYNYTNYNSIDPMEDNSQTKNESQKKMHTNSSLRRRQFNQQANLQVIYQKKRSKRYKQTLQMSKPVTFQFNLPRLPEKQKNMQTKLKQQSKIVLIQSGRYKFLDTLDPNDVAEMGKRRNKSYHHSLDMRQLRQKQRSPQLDPQRSSSNKIQQYDKRSISILQIITKKKKNVDQKYKKALYSSVFLKQIDETITSHHQQQKTKDSKQKNFKDHQGAQRQLKQILLNLQPNNFDSISAWQRGEQTPLIN